MDQSQPALPGLSAPRRRARVRAAATALPVARVLVDTPVPHLDRPFDYLVPAELEAVVRPGVRVKVRLAGTDHLGYVLERVETSDHPGELTPLRRVVSAEQVLGPQTLALARAVAQRWAGTTADVLRLAIPPRHARVEAEVWPEVEEPPAAVESRPDPGPAGRSTWYRHVGAAAFLRRAAAGEAPWAVWQALPWTAQPWTEQVAEAVAQVRSAGRGALVVVPTGGDVALVLAALSAAGVPAWQPGERGGAVRLVAEDGPVQRYRAYLAASRGLADVVVGTRAAAFAPLARPGLLVCWDEADPLHAEPRAPYPHAREVLALRAQGVALLVGGYARSVATQRWLAEGRAHLLAPERSVVRASAPRPVHLDRAELARDGAAAAARLPSAAWRAIRDALGRGPVLVQVPRAGYLPVVACARCRAPARCATCAGPLRLNGAGQVPACGWCGALAGAWRCATCGHPGLRATVVGAERTAEELGRAFPGVRVRRSSAAHGVLAAVGRARELVVATPGAEPPAEAGYAAAILLDAQSTADRGGLDAELQALRHWLAAAALVRGAGDAGLVQLIGDLPEALAGAFVRWDPGALAERALAERTELALPPATHLMALDGPRSAVGPLLAAVQTPTTVRGPIPVGPPPEGVLDPELDRPVRALLVTAWEHAPALVAELRGLVAARSARREAPVRVRVEPQDVD